MIVDEQVVSDLGYSFALRNGHGSKVCGENCRKVVKIESFCRLFFGGLIKTTGAGTGDTDC